MDKKKRFILIIFLLIASLIITWGLLNLVGKPVENLGTNIYRKLTGKPGQRIEYDQNGVPYVLYESNIGKQYNVVTIAEYALKLSVHPEHDSEEKFFNCTKRLIDNIVILNDSSILFPLNYDWPGYEMKAPWRSAMNQGRAMQVFLKAFEKSKDTLYLNYAVRSMNALFTEVKDGGVTYIDSNGYWFEEYADDGAPQSRVLNGMIVVLQGLSGFQNVTNDNNAKFLFLKSVESLKNSIHLYDNNGHSNYDILGKTASAWYHKFHIEQLEFLYNETGEPVFNKYKTKWENYKEPSYLTALYRKPTNIGMFTVFSIFVTVFVVLFLVSYFLWFRKPRTSNFEP